MSVPSAAKDLQRRRSIVVRLIVDEDMVDNVQHAVLEDDVGYHDSDAHGDVARRHIPAALAERHVVLLAGGTRNISRT